VTATKPEDWDETQPRKIPNGSQVKPADWDENMPEKIADPKVAKPEIWDDEEVSCSLMAFFRFLLAVAMSLIDTIIVSALVIVIRSSTLRPTFKSPGPWLRCHFFLAPFPA
jgi:hypothetical protein